jgi:hypothetical protein
VGSSLTFEDGSGAPSGQVAPAPGARAGYDVAVGQPRIDSAVAARADRDGPVDDASAGALDGPDDRRG